LRIRSAAPAEEIRRLSNALDERFERTPFSVGPFHGHRTKRFHRLLARAPGSVELVMHWQVLEIGGRAVLAAGAIFRRSPHPRR
jgi:hypothetical protein